jgi:TonB family protein
VELNLLLDWGEKRTRSQWAAILGASLGLHLALFVIGIQIPSLLGQYRQQPERTVIVHRIPLYLPRDAMTQKAPNTQEVAKQVDLADLQESKASRPGGRRRPPSVRQFEIPKQAPVKQMARNEPPKILPEAPSLTMNENANPAPGVPGGLPVPAPPPPAQETAGPFQNLGSEAAPPNPHPTLRPPTGGVEGAIQELHQQANSQHLAMSDDAPERRAPGGIGALAQAPAQHAAVELQTDANGADFKIYLRTILAIVRGNWRKVIPESARMGTLRGRTVVEFIIDRDGSIPKLVTADPSGSEPLDRAAVAGLSMSNPLPPLPTDFKGFQVRLAFTFAYNMPAK